jgi:hypothetical protein
MSDFESILKIFNYLINVLKEIKSICNLKAQRGPFKINNVIVYYIIVRLDT